MNLKQQLQNALDGAKAIAQKAKNENRNLTASEVTAFDAKMAEVENLKGQIKQAEESEARFKALSAINPEFKGHTGKVLSFKGLDRAVKADMEERGGFHVKALIEAGSSNVLPEATESPVSLGKPATGLLDILPVRFVEGTDEYSYLTQVTRTNNAAPVAQGALKPTSTYTLKRVTRKLEVIAHLSEAIPEYWLKDNAALGQFIRDEMGYGIQLATENQVLNGTGVSPNLLGILAVSGIQTQAFNTSQIRTVRSAITKVETLGYNPSGLALNPLDWEAIETAADAEERFFMTPNGSPIDRAARRLWSVPVALTTAIAQGRGVLLTDGAAGLVSDGDVTLALGRSGDDFDRNQVKARVEGRFGVEVLRPLGVVDIDLSAA